MKIFVTGASGFIGSAVVSELLSNGYEVLGLARSDASAAAIEKAGAEVIRGELSDIDSLRQGAESTDGVIHTAFIHDFSAYNNAAEIDRCAIETFGEALAGSDRPLVVAAGTAGIMPGRVATEEDSPRANMPRFSETAALETVSRGVRASVMRLPPTVHGEGDHGFVPFLINIAREKGISAYPGDGSNRWAGVHRLDAARLFRLALENAPAGTILHAIGDEGVSTRDIATAIGQQLDVPLVSVPVEQAGDHFGFLSAFFSMDIPASSTLTQARFDWHPTHPTLLEDLAEDYYFGG